MRMEHLRVGHQVLVMNEATGQTVYERVDSFIHRRPDIETTFHQLKTASGTSLTLSPEHLVPVVQCDALGSSSTLKYARNTQVGECVMVNHEGSIQQSRIVQKEEVQKTGIFAPLTKSGNLLVDDVVASCYSAYEGYYLQNSFYRLYSMLTNFLIRTADTLSPMDAPPVLHLFETINSV